MHVVHEMTVWGRYASSTQMYLRCFYFTSQKSGGSQERGDGKRKRLDLGSL